MISSSQVNTALNGFYVFCFICKSLDKYHILNDAELVGSENGNGREYEGHKEGIVDRF